MSVESTDLMPDGWKHRLTSDSVCAEWRGEEGDAEMLRVDAGRHLGFARLVARKSLKTNHCSIPLHDPAFKQRGTHMAGDAQVRFNLAGRKQIIR